MYRILKYGPVYIIYMTIDTLTMPTNTRMTYSQNSDFETTFSTNLVEMSTQCQRLRQTNAHRDHKHK